VLLLLRRLLLLSGHFDGTGLGELLLLELLSELVGGAYFGLSQLLLTERFGQWLVLLLLLSERFGRARLGQLLLLLVLLLLLQMRVWLLLLLLLWRLLLLLRLQLLLLLSGHCGGTGLGELPLLVLLLEPVGSAYFG